MKVRWIFIIVAFFGILYVLLNYSSNDLTEGFRPRCPNVLIQRGNEIWLKNTNLADIPGVNPVVFHNLEEYTQFVEWQRSQGINCPVLHLKKSYDAQNEVVYKVQEPTLLLDASRNDPPYNTNSYPGMDPHNQTIGQVTPLDEIYMDKNTQDK
jgi:hypothetical protein